MVLEDKLAETAPKKPLALTIGAAAVTLVVIIGVLAGPSLVTCFNSADGMGLCLRGKMTDAGILPQPPAVATTDVEAPATDAVALVEPSDETAVGEPALDVTPSPEASDDLIAATFGLLRAEPDGSVVIAGSGTPGTEIEVYSGDSLLGKTTVEPSGDWVLVPDALIPPGDTEITLAEAGKPGRAAQSFVVVIDDDKSSEPLVVASTPGAISQVLQGLGRPAAADTTQLAAADPVTTPAAADAPASPAPATAPAEPAPAPEAAAPDATPATPSPTAATNAPPVEPDTSPAEPSSVEPAPDAAPPSAAAEPAAAPPAPTADGTAAVAAPPAPAPATPAPPAAAAPAPEEPAADEPATAAAASEEVATAVATADPVAPASPAAPVATAPAPAAVAISVPPTIDAIEIEGDRSFFAGAGPEGATMRLYVDDTFIADATVSDGRWLVEAGKVLTRPEQRVRIDMLQSGSADVAARAEVDFVVELPVSDVPTAVTAAETPATSASVEPTAPPAELASAAEPTTAAEPVQQPEPVPAATEPAPVAVAQAEPPAAPAPAAEPTAAADAPAATPAPVATPTPEPDVPTLVAVAVGGPDAERFASGKAIIRRGDNLWTIARRRYGEGIKYTTIYDANTGQIRDPDQIYPGQVFDLPN